MNNRKPAILLVLALLLTGGVSTASAQNYRFAVPKLQMQVEVNKNATVKITYDITFQNQSPSQPIDIVDIGLPHGKYDLKTFSASIGGAPLSDIRHSEFVKPGVEIHLHQHAISGVDSGTLHVEFTMPDLIYQDTTKAENASLRITPTWFDNKFVNGMGTIEIYVILPVGVKPEEVLYHDKKFTSKAVVGEEKQVVVGWKFENRRATMAHLVGVSFPKRVVDKVITVSAIDLLVKWFEESPQTRVVVGLCYLVGFGWLFFRFTGGTGVTLFAILGVAQAFWFAASAGAQLAVILPLGLLIACNEWYLSRRKRKYLPPIAEVEGGGIKRGLTAPEAAILLELPLGKVLGLIIFGLLKKRVLSQQQADPLIVSVNPQFQVNDENGSNRKARAKFYRGAAVANKTVIHEYEHPFLFLLDENPGKPVSELNFSTAMKLLLNRVAKRMKGFDLSDTQDYYRSIVAKAAKMAQEIGDIDQRTKMVDKNFEWLLMGDDYPTVFMHRGSYYRPIWTRSSHHGGSSLPSGDGGSAVPDGTTTFSDVTSSLAGWTENTMGSLASTISPDALGTVETAGGVLDLSGIDRVTGDVLKAMAESGGSGGGGGSGCACACAGCACACACAGGGR